MIDLRMEHEKNWPLVIIALVIVSTLLFCLPEEKIPRWDYEKAVKACSDLYMGDPVRIKMHARDGGISAEWLSGCLMAHKAYWDRRYEKENK